MTDTPEPCDYGCGDTGTHFCYEWDAWSCDTCCDMQNKGIKYPECPRFDNRETPDEKGQD